MRKLIVTGNSVLLGTAAPSSTDAFANGVRKSATGGLNRATTTGGTIGLQGLLMTHTGQLQYVNATAGLPSNTTWTNGLPLSGGALCVSTNPAVTYSNGIPFAANGAVAAGIIP